MHESKQMSSSAAVGLSHITMRLLVRVLREKKTLCLACRCHRHHPGRQQFAPHSMCLNNQVLRWDFLLSSWTNGCHTSIGPFRKISLTFNWFLINCKSLTFHILVLVIISAPLTICGYPNFPDKLVHFQGKYPIFTKIVVDGSMDSNGCWMAEFRKSWLRISRNKCRTF